MTSTRHLALLGGLRTTPAVATDSYTIVTAVGGVNLDLGAAALPDGGVTVTKVSLVGGAHVRVPAGSPVDVHGFCLVGARHQPPPLDAGSAPPVRVRVYGLFGGVDIDRS